MADAIAVLGSRHGLIFDPIQGNCKIIRFDPFDQVPPIEIRAGVRVNGQEYLFPLCKEGNRFAFFDQRITPTTARWIAIEPHSGLKISLCFSTPFRPRDSRFSVIPALGIRMEVERISGNFRWTPVTEKVESLELFFEIRGEILSIEAGQDGLDLRFQSQTTKAKAPDPEAQLVWQHDRIICRSGQLDGKRFGLKLSPERIGIEALELIWCTHSEPVLQVGGILRPFKYSKQFPSLDAVCDWGRRSGGELFENAVKVDRIVGANDLSASINHLLAQTLHSWLVNTWWVEWSERDWFSVWEGNCHFHSTVDVEFTQSPFYLAVWPELLGIELGMWPEFSKEGTQTLGERGAGTLFLSHDCGSMAVADGQAYHHDMEVEETTNYLILSYAYWRRAGDFSIAREKETYIRKYLAFLVACDTRGTGIPEIGISNTIDDASPAIQYGREQVYLATKTMAAFQCGAAILCELGHAAEAQSYLAKAARIRQRIDEVGWKEDHYATLLCPSSEGLKNPWTGKALDTAEVPGWDNCHIYTQNGLAVLDMVGFDSGLDPERLRIDLRTAAERCLREYGCAHTDYSADEYALGGLQEGMVGVASNPGWISMNMMRDIAAFYRGVDLRHLADRYWQWQVTTNTQMPTLFFETFSGNNLHFYPRGIAIWGYFDALAGRIIDRVSGREECCPRIPGIRVPQLLDVDWSKPA